MESFEKILDVILKAAGVLDVMFFVAYSIRNLIDKIFEWRNRDGKR